MCYLVTYIIGNVFQGVCPFSLLFLLCIFPAFHSSLLVSALFPFATKQLTERDLGSVAANAFSMYLEPMEC